MNTVLLHGFWGSPQDWTAVTTRLPLGLRLWIPDLYQPGPLAPHHNLKDWTQHFLEELQMQFGSEPVQIAGYSMGGRLALNALLAEPKRFRRALILSGRPGMPEPEAKGREAWEFSWAKKFQSEPWLDLTREWQRLEIFAASPGLPRRETPILREMLAQSLVNWSPRHHAEMPSRVQELPASVDWAFGALDQKYMEVAKWLQDLPVRGQIVQIPNAGHRLIVEAVDFVADWLNRDTNRE